MADKQYKYRSEISQVCQSAWALSLVFLSTANGLPGLGMHISQ